MKTVFDLHKPPFHVDGAPGAIHFIMDADKRQMAQCKNCATAHAICDELNTVWRCEYQETA